MTKKLRSLRTQLARAIRTRGWTRGQHEGGLLHRLHDLLVRRTSWYDWGHPLMILIGRYDTGTWDVPRVRDLWFRPLDGGRFETTRDYNVVRDRNDGEWRIFDSQDTGHTIVIGYWPAPGEGNIRQTGLDGRTEQRLFLRWLVWDGLVKAEWFGLRRWLYYKALHAGLYAQKPFSCKDGSRAHAHWRCELPRRHNGAHRFRNYTWITDETAQYNPVEATR